MMAALFVNAGAGCGHVGSDRDYGGGRDGNVAAVRHTDWAATNGEHTAGSTHRRGARNIISPLFSMLMGLLTLAVAKMPKLSLPPLAAMSPQLTILTGLSPNLVSTLMPLPVPLVVRLITLPAGLVRGSVLTQMIA